ncbi:hypothetical protein ACFYKX_26430 [Cytobacillus sp. FJAT-54145]|uniref:Uncharacterized protein n=1 Tax=Cytobacillus spartinae TaxID=3299023 RepID=A0ABW6KK31_9BACI
MSAGLITRKLLKHLYTKRGLSDSEIASFIGIDRTAICHLRKAYDIKTRKSVGELGEEYVIKKLTALGCEVKNLNEQDKTSLYDLLVNKVLRIEVKTASDLNGTFNFSLTNKPECNHIESDHRIFLPNGRSKKLYRKTCDYIVCVGIKGKQVYPFVIPSKDIPDNLQNIRIRPKRSHKYNEYFQKWEYIKKPDAPTSDPK